MSACMSALGGLVVLAATLTGTVDRIEGEFAVVEWETASVADTWLTDVPLTVLPPGLGEGDRVRVWMGSIPGAPDSCAEYPAADSRSVLASRMVVMIRPMVDAESTDSTACRDVFPVFPAGPRQDVVVPAPPALQHDAGAPLVSFDMENPDDE